MKRRTALVLALLMMALALTACTSEQAPAATGAPAETSGAATEDPAATDSAAGTTVDGETADESKQEWWGYSVNGAFAELGVDSQPVADGDVYDFVLNVGW